MGNIQTVQQQPTICGICFEEKIAVHGSINKTNTKCSKPHPFCHDCVGKHILYKLQEKTAMIRCPGVDCSAVLDPVACCSLIPAESFVEWSDLLVDTWIARQGHRRAVCPYEKCSEVIIDECRGGGRQKCPKCSGVFCFGCGVEWSKDHHRVCAFEETVFLQAARQWNWQRCPTCRFFVQRRTGCNMIKCRCGTTFCYKCGRQGCRCGLGICASSCLVTLLVCFAVCMFLLLHKIYW